MRFALMRFSRCLNACIKPKNNVLSLGGSSTTVPTVLSRLKRVLALAPASTNLNLLLPSQAADPRLPYISATYLIYQQQVALPQRNNLCGDQPRHLSPSRESTYTSNQRIRPNRQTWASSKPVVGGTSETHKAHLSRPANTPAKTPTQGDWQRTSGQ
jgi:hypothetical protein